jgi:hypothetical protein
LELSAQRVIIDGVDVSTADIAKIPAANVRVPQAEFAALWQRAERHHDEQVRRGVPDWYGAGVVMTCRWLANAIVRHLSAARARWAERTWRAVRAARNGAGMEAREGVYS